MIHIISLGAGVQSTTMALMAAAGEITPMPDCAIFADTGAEPKAIYSHLDWLETQLPFTVHRVSAGNLRLQIEGAMRGDNRMDARPPFYTLTGGMLNRQCTHDFKIVPIMRKVRELIGLKKGACGPKVPIVEQWIGISTDEMIRMKDARVSYTKHRWPLIEKGMSRAACLAWCSSRGFPQPAKSACTFCPLHNDAHWRDMRANDPVSFAEAVAIDKAIRPGMAGPRRPKDEQWFIHRSRVPLDEVDLSTAAERGQIEFGFLQECEGMCGV